MCLAVPGKVTSIEGEDPVFRHGNVDFGGVKRDVNFAFVPDVVLGDYVLVHVGFALERVDEEEAQKIFAALDELGRIEDEISG